MHSPTHRFQSLLRSADGQVLFTDKASILSRWSEYFQSLFSADRVVPDPAVLHIPQKPFKADLYEQLSMKEITKAIEYLRSDKAAGVDEISPELWKEEGPTLHGLESWVTYRHHLRTLEHFYQRCLRTILKIPWSNYVSNVEVIDQAEITSIEAMLLKSQLQRAEDVSRMGGALPAKDSLVCGTLHWQL